jgi:Leucine-rich repeat (LRR) protein
VSELYLSSNNLTGQLPAAIGSFPYLTVIFISGNSFSGPLPDEIGSLTQLEYFYFRWGEIQGGIPASIGNLTHLREFVASYTNFTGSLPNEIGMLSELTRLDLSRNNFTGAIPSSIGGLISLLEMDLQSCGLSGKVPAEIGNLSQLQTLILRNNQLSGSIPTSIGQLQNLLVLDLSRNQFTGSLPDEIGLLTNLTSLVLWNNQLTGPLPASIDGLVSLTTLSIGFNQFSGKLPPELFALSQLVHLDLSENQFSGQLPEELGELGLLTGLNIGKNLFTGTLPASLGNLGLISLEITDNDFSGSLPDVINWDDMTSLTISRTNLSGPLPLVILNLPNLQYLRVTSNQFSGQIPEILDSELRFRRIDLSGNQLSGEIPASLTDIWRLEELYLHSNALSGELPAGLWNMPRLEYLDLHSNQLEGQLPESAALPELRGLYLGSNQFAGGLPEAIWKLPKLQSIHLENNHLSGELSEDFWRHDQITALDLSSNQFTGQIPAAFGMTRLSHLNLSGNQFMGALPETFGDSIWMRYLNLSNNLFTGLLPTWIGSFTNLRTLDIHSNHFHGEIPYAITNLIQLNQPMWDYQPNGYTDIGYNHLTSADPDVRAFLAVKDPDWESTQTYGNLAPKLVSIQPDAVLAGSSDTQLKLHGSGFMNGALVYWNGTALPTTFHSDTLLVAAVSKSRLASKGTVSITSQNPSPTYGFSEPVSFHILPSRSWQTTRISLSSIGEQANGPSSASSISADGRYIAFDSLATNLLPGNPSGYWQVYVYDQQSGQLERISVNLTDPIAHHSRGPSLSADGRYVVFFSTYPASTGPHYQIYVHDRQTGLSELVSKSSTGEPGSGSHSSPGISLDGRYVVFSSDAANLVPDDTNFNSDVFLHDRSTGTTDRISLTHLGEETYDGSSEAPSISADGRYVVFQSAANDLVPEDNNYAVDVFVRDLVLGTIERVSVSSSGTEGNRESFFEEISADGRYILFSSNANNLVPDVPPSFFGKVYVRDRLLETTEAITPYATAEYSVSTQQGSISNDGRFVTFLSTFNPDNPNEPFEYNQIFLHDRLMGKYYWLPLTWDGQAHNDHAGFHKISGDGRFIVFSSDASNLVPNDTNQQTDIFLLNHCLSGTCYPVTYHPVPVIGSLNPPSIIPPAGDLILQVRGKNFVEGATILWNGEKVPTTYLAPYALQTTIPAHKLVEIGAVPVTVENPKLTSAPSEPFNFYISDILPADNSTVLTLRPHFWWPVVPGAFAYCIEIYGSSNFTFSNLLMHNTSTENFFTPKWNLPPNKTIYWRVSVYKNGNYDPWMPTHTFRSANPPSKPAPLSPSNNSLSTDYKPKLTWSQSSLPVGTTFEHYQLQIAPDTSFETVVLNHFGSKRAQPSYTLPLGVLQPDTKYFWRVRASNTLGHPSDWSKTFSIRTAMLPPGLSKPETGSTALTYRPEFEWSTVENASSYTIQLSLYGSFSDLILSATPAGTQYIPTKNLPQNRTIYWRVRSNGTNGPSAWERSSFTSANPPSTPSLVSPANNALNTSYAPKLTWRQSTLPTGTTFQHYLLQIATGASFDPADLVLEQAITDRTKPTYTLTPGLLQPNTQYFWRVQAANSIGHLSNWSAARSIRSAMLPTTLTAPLEASTALTRRPEFSWTAVDGASSYTIQISLYSNFSTLFLTASPTGTAYTPTKNLTQNKTIYWRVRANGANGPSLWNKSSFKSANPPATPALLSPLNSALNTNYVPLLKWGASTLPTGTTFRHYRLQVATDNGFNDLAFEKLIDSRITPFYQVVLDDALQPNTRYFWRVQAENTLDQTSTWSAVRYFRSAMLPTTLTTPVEASTALTRRPDFAWTAVDGATSYTIQLSLSATFGTLLTSAAPNSPAYTVTISLPQNKIIHWRVRANGPNGPSLWTKGSFTSANPPSTPSLLSPASGALLKTLTPRLDWSTSTLPAGTAFGRYELDIATDTAFTTYTRYEVLDRTLSEWNDWTGRDPLLPKTKYYWRVRALNADWHESNWSAHRSFTTP